MSTCEYCNHDHAPDPFFCIARLQEKIEAVEESHAWEISPAMAQAKIDELNAEVGRLKATITEREKELSKLRAFWEWSRLSDKQSFEQDQSAFNQPDEQNENEE